MKGPGCCPVVALGTLEEQRQQEVLHAVAPAKVRESPHEDKDSSVPFSNHFWVSPMKQEALCYSRTTGLCKEMAVG